MRIHLRRMGNSSGVIIPKPLLAQLGIEAGGSLDLTLEEGRIVLVPVKGHPRAGWAEAAREIAGSRGDASVWPEFGNAGDEELRW